MRKINLITLVLWTISVAAMATALPQGKAALAEAVIGKVSVDQGQKTGFEALKVGQTLAAGSTIKTGSNGRATLRLPDGSMARLAPNTELTLKAEAVRRGIFTRLLLGTVRFLVVKQAAGNSFETELPNAVAAVKGTDPEYETDGTVSTAKVFSSGNPIALLFTDTKSGEETSLKAGDKLVFDGDAFKLEKIEIKDTEDSDKNYEGLPPAKEETLGEGEGDGKGAPANTNVGDSGSGDKNLTEGIEHETQAAMDEAMGDLYLDGFLERDDRTGDVFAGKIIYDRFGDRVQVSNYVTRPDPQTVAISSYSKRDTGPNAGLSLAVEASSFNQALPQNWVEVFALKLDDPSNLNASGYPIYWRKTRDFLAMNPWGDAIVINTVYRDPLTSGFVATPGPLFQGYTQNILLKPYSSDTGVVVQSISWGMSGMPVGTSYEGTPSSSQGWTNYASVFEGGWRFEFTNYNPGDSKSSNATFLSEDIHFLDDFGNVLQHPTYTGIPAVPGDVFHNFDANVEVAFNSPLFNGRSIDVLYRPGFFDLVRLIEHPYESNSFTPTPPPCTLC